MTALKASKGSAPITVFFTLNHSPLAPRVPMTKVGVPLICIPAVSAILF
jgi:hypothetical protein